MKMSLISHQGKVTSHKFKRRFKNQQEIHQKLKLRRNQQTTMKTKNLEVTSKTNMNFNINSVC